MAEAEFRRALLISRGEIGFLFERPISMVLIALVLLVLLIPLIRRLRGRRKGGIDLPTQPDA
jgi:putative tricarboxylic transport membrane protein